MKKTTPPATLYDACVLQTQNTYARRMKELKDLKKKLALLDEFTPALQAKGVWLTASSIHLDDKWPRRPAVGVQAFYPRHDGPIPRRKLLDTLLELGFVEEEREVGNGYAYFLVRNGQLRLSFVTGYPLEEPAAPASAAAQEPK